VESLIRPAAPDAGFASIYLHTDGRMTETAALSSRIGYVETRRDAQGGLPWRTKKLLGEDAVEERT
jgi:hypothetical protein